MSTATNNIANNIDLSYQLDKELLFQWNNIIEVLKNKYIEQTISVEPVIAVKFKFDMEGLFKFLNIDNSIIYPHIRVNGYPSSSAYDGRITDIHILSPNVKNYYKLFTSKK